MVKENPNKESCKERMKELIRTKHLNRNRVVKRCMREFDGVHKSTFYGWYDEVINEPDIQQWEEERRLEAVSEYQQKLGPLIHEDTVVYVCTPPNCYPDLIQFINHIDQGTLVLEKPLSLNYEQYLDLKPSISPRIQMIDHFLYKVDVQRIITEFSGPLKSIHFRFLYPDDVEKIMSKIEKK